ncbi:MAG: hypothetical protein HWE22_02205 [Flavobacteriales bacterium]|nr:hypothetical protein [Flavobacteriales bacterium]
MAITNHSFDTYRVYHYNADNTYGQTAVVNCYSGSSFKGSLYFYKEGASVPASSKTGSGYLYLRFSEKQFNEIITTLREEKPLNMGFNDSNNWGWVSTSQEPVGEEES